MENNKEITLSYGSGGRQTADFIDNEIAKRFSSNLNAGLPDAAHLPSACPNGILMTTDSFVVTPLIFPGGDIGKLAVYGTVNDIAVSGGKPLWLSLALIIEEGFPMEDLRHILDSIKQAASECNVQIVTGDTKVVAKGQCDKLFINTTGVGIPLDHFNIDKNRISAGDKVIVSGPIGDHGLAVMTAREGINFEKGPISDCAPVFPLVEQLKPYGKSIKFMRDPTRGGLTSVLYEIIIGKLGIQLLETAIPFAPETKSTSEMLGIDLLSSACEGCIVLICKADVADNIIRDWHTTNTGPQAAIIGEVVNTHQHVAIETLIGANRIVDYPYGEILPRIC